MVLKEGSYLCVKFKGGKHIILLTSQNMILYGYIKDLKRTNYESYIDLVEISIHIKYRDIIYNDIYYIFIYLLTSEENSVLRVTYEIKIA